MATIAHSSATAMHRTLTANTVETVQITGGYDYVKVKNRGSADIYFRVDGTDPVIGADDTYIVSPNEAVTVQGPQGAQNIAVGLISSAASSYSLIGV